MYMQGIDLICDEKDCICHRSSCFYATHVFNFNVFCGTEHHLNFPGVHLVSWVPAFKEFICQSDV